MKRRIFYSFHYAEDNWRASQVRNMGILEGNRPATDNNWEAIKGGGPPAIKRWIDKEMEGRTCTVVLVGSKTAQRKWIDYEIVQSWKKKMGIVGIYVHGLRDRNGIVSSQGYNPFDYFDLDEHKFSKIVRCYNPPGISSRLRYGWIAKNISNAIEEAIWIRNKYQ